jgi:multiple sugar transport system substrate-binding protein
MRNSLPGGPMTGAVIGFRIDLALKEKCRMSAHPVSRRKFLKLAAAGAAGAVLVSCAPTTQPGSVVEGKEPEAKAPAAKNVTLQYYIGFGAGREPEQVDGVKKMFERYASASNGAVAVVEPMIVPWDEAPRKFQTMVAGGTPPDVITMGMSQWDFAAKGAFVDINPLALGDNVDLNQWDKSAIDAYTVAPRKNMLYGLPFGANDMFLVVNKTLFQEAGVELPPSKWDDPSWTIDAFIDKASKITKGEGVNKTWGVTGIGGNWSVPWFYGGAWVDEKLENIIVDKPGSIEGLQLNYDLMHLHKYMPTAAESEALGNGFLSGRVGMYVEGAWGVNTLLTITDFDWDIYPVPIGPGSDINKRAIPYYPDSLVISSKNAVDESWGLLKFMLLNDDNYKEFCKIMSMIPARKGPFRDWFVNEFWKASKPDANFDAVMDGFSYAQVQRLFFNINWSEVNNTQSADLDPVWVGTATVDQVVPEMAKKLQEIWTRGNEQLKAS